MSRPRCLCDLREWTLPAVAEYLLISVDRLKHILCELGPVLPVRYRRLGKHPRRCRVLTTEDVFFIQALRWGLVSLTDGAPGGARNAVPEAPTATNRRRSPVAVPVR